MIDACPTCNGECCYLHKREGTIRYAELLPHSKGIHWCKDCECGQQTNIEEQQSFYPHDSHEYCERIG